MDFIGLLFICGLVLIWGGWLILWRQWHRDERRTRGPGSGWYPQRFIYRQRKILATAAAAVLSLLWTAAIFLTFLSGSPPIQSEFELFAQVVAEKMAPLSAAFFAPSPVKRDETFEASLRVSPPSITPEEVARALADEAGRAGVSAHDVVRYEPIYVASLISDRESRIVLQGESASRAVVYGETITWRWYVSASDGPVRLTATLNTPLTINGMPTATQVHAPFTKTVTVTVTPAQRFGDVLAFVKEYWVLLAAAVAGLGWLWARWKRYRGPPPPKSYETAT